MDWLDTVQRLMGEEGTDITWWQMSNRAVVIFFYGVFLVRLAGRRVFGQLAPLDIVVSLIIGSNLSRALTGTVPLAQTLVATTVLVVLHAVLAWLILRVPALSTLLKGRAVRLVRDGDVDRAALRKNALGEHDFEEVLRSSGVETPESLRGAWLERNGKFSVVKKS
jgi:uncharacterized membrane protein YcaP (DUF421 family)